MIRESTILTQFAQMMPSYSRASTLTAAVRKDSCRIPVQTFELKRAETAKSQPQCVISARIMADQTRKQRSTSTAPPD